ncbi:hypothetical protein [Mucilaginibacter lappiensis]|uniref:SMI1 / KNR4 family (SUKH-1) n=1 Tax=Mucilaginibacter lappiensis TaxID=354630 RepID=A0A841J668_9SPHI|nr:hypothetical protein [Mucilaginibacter lappiensis]MBB6126533.1 hypothetical protein [Mucilaginibacter lappiensis]
MEIKYQTVLNNNPVIRPTAGDMADGRDHSFVLKPLTIDEIISLETTYNSGNQFPTSLRELLFIAGQDCYVLDYGLNENQEEMQDDARGWLVDRSLNIITRPFFVIDVHRGSSVFLFVYLDEGINDPIVYQADLDSNLDPSYSRLMSLEAGLSSFVNARISYLLRGINPY